MTDTGSKENLLKEDLTEDKVAGTAEAEPTPAPEPWTPRRVLEWNSYFDLYVAGFVVLLAFLGTANKIPANNSAIWSLLQAGRQIAETKGCTVAQLAIAWVLSRGEHIIPIPGTKRRKYLLDNAGAVDVTLNSADHLRIEELLKKYPDIGDRYNEANYRFVDKN